MALTGKLEADFSDFYAAAEKAQGSLRGMEGAAVRVQSSLTQMSGASGGLTTAQRLMSSLGVSISPQIALIKDLEQTVTDAGSAFTGFATAGAVAASAMAGWKVGRAIAEWLDLDDAIAGATARLLGWGDVAAQETAAKNDVLMRATLLAGRAIHSTSEAMDIIAKAAKDARDAADALTLSYDGVKSQMAAAYRATLALTDAKKEHIVWLDKQGLSNAEIARGEQVTEGVVRRVLELRQLEADIAEKRIERHKKETQELEKRAAAEKAAADAHIARVKQTREGLTGEDEVAKARLYIEAMQTSANVLKLNTEAKRDFVEQMYRAIDAQVRAGKGTDDLTKKMVEWAAAATASGRAAAAAFKVAEEAAKQAAAWTAMVAANQAAAIAGIPPGGNIWASGMAVPTGGNLWTSDMPATSPNLWTGGTVAGSSVAPVIVNVNAQGAFLDTPTDTMRLASKVGDAFIRTSRP